MDDLNYILPIDSINYHAFYFIISSPVRKIDPGKINPSGWYKLRSVRASIDQIPGRY